MTKNEAHKLFESLMDDLLQASQHLCIARAYRALVKEFADEIKKTPDFWGLTYWAHIDAAIFRLCRVYDTSGFSLEKLLREIQQNSTIYDAKKLNEHYAKLPRACRRQVQEIKPKPLATDILQVASDNPLVGMLREWRNKRFSHKTPPDVYAPEKLGRDYPLRIMDLETLQEIGLKILNYYGEIVFNQTGQVTGDDESQIRSILASVRSSPLTMGKVLGKQLS
jgi:hypothetical protein